MSPNHSSPDATDSSPSGSAFAAAPPDAPTNPFIAVSQDDSAFLQEMEEDFHGGVPRASKLPAPRKPVQSPFQLADPPKRLGFKSGSAPRLSAMPLEPGTMVSPFAQPAPAVPVLSATGIPSPFIQVHPPGAPSPTLRLPATSGDGFPSDLPLEFKEIFALDHDPSHAEILHLARTLPGVQHVAIVRDEDRPGFHALKQTLVNLGFSGENIKLALGTSPIEFVREGKVMLAVQTHGAFAPGVRDILAAAARELSRPA